MNTPTPSPAPQWAINVAKAIHNESWHGMTYDQMVNSGAAIITEHAAALIEENKRLKWEVERLKGVECQAWNLIGIMDRFEREMRIRCERGNPDAVVPILDEMKALLHTDTHREHYAVKMSTESYRYLKGQLAQLTALRQWTEQAREAMEELCHDHRTPWKAKYDALLQSHPAATNLTEEGK